MVKEKDGTPSRSGEFAWRSIRYLAAVIAGYLLGIAAAGSAATPLPKVAAIAVASMALVLVFRSGRKSVAHAAADAVAEARAEARAAAQAVATNVVQLGSGNQAAAVPVTVPSVEVPSIDRLSSLDSYVLELGPDGYEYIDEVTGRRWVLHD